MKWNTGVFTRLFFLAAMLLGGVSAYSATPAEDSAVLSARKAVEYFCQIEFEGDQGIRRSKVARYSKKETARREKERTPTPVDTLDFEYDALFVVASYRVLDVTVKGKQASVSVVYSRLATRTKGKGSQLHFAPDGNDNDLVTLTLVYDKNQWWVLDPPPPRVSKQPLIEYYEYQVKEYSPMWEQKLNDPSYSEKQKANVRANRDQATGTLKLLNSLE